MPLVAAAWFTAEVASLSDLPGARLNEIVVAGETSWWLTVVGTEVWVKAASARRGTTFSAGALAAARVEAPRLGGATGPPSALTGAAPGAPALVVAVACRARVLTAPFA